MYALWTLPVAIALGKAGDVSVIHLVLIKA